MSQTKPASIGHNKGPTLEPGQGWRRFAWRKARADLLPSLPIEVVRIRVKRAAEIGMDYRSYARVRASTGHDIVAILFSSNALRLFRDQQNLSVERAAKLALIQNCERRGLAIAPLSVPKMGQATEGHLDGVSPAPPAFASWASQRDHIRGAYGAGLAADHVLLIGDTSEERRWSEAGRLAGYLPASQYFSAP
ncbi:MAG: hypothetical protein ACPGNV_00430 [Mangrovicoccus sp.]